MIIGSPRRRRTNARATGYAMAATIVQPIMDPTMYGISNGRSSVTS
jgi:hypothetical protein